MASHAPQSVLFMCDANAVRSPTAAVIARHYFGRSLYVRSAGVRPGEKDAFAETVLAELGLTMAGHAPRTLDDLEDTNFDLVITLTPDAHHAALELTRLMAIEVIYWPTPDPTLETGSRERRLDAYRAMRDGLKARIVKMFG